MSLITTHRRKKFHRGLNDYLGENDDTGLKFQIIFLPPGQELNLSFTEEESALLVLQGEGSFEYQSEKVPFHRPHWKTHNPWALHFPAGDQVKVSASSRSSEPGIRLALLQTFNPERFPGKIYSPSDVQVEDRGLGLLEDTCHRQVRLIFDGTIAPPSCKLVLGEVLNRPGRWSSYPPHHHPQPEIYYYEFDREEEGYGHAELGESVFKIYHQDLLKITDNLDHSQVSAPGFTMYYLWAIRHLEDNPYRGFVFTPPYDKLLSGK